MLAIVKRLRVCFEFQGLLVATSVYLLIHIGLQIKKQKMEYLKEFWNCFEFVMFLLAVLSVVTVVLKIAEDTGKTAQIAARKREYVSLAKNLELDARWSHINAFIMFMITIWVRVNIL